jgi:hypothetical protein
MHRMACGYRVFVRSKMAFAGGYVAKDKAGRSLVSAVEGAVTSDEFVLVD